MVAGHHNKMCACEMGRENALIVLDDANLEIAVNAAIISAFKTSGAAMHLRQPVNCA